MHAIVRVRMPVDCLSVERLLLVIGPYIPKLFAVADRLGVDLEDRDRVDELARVRFDGHGAGRYGPGDRVTQLDRESIEDRRPFRESLDKTQVVAAAQSSQRCSAKRNR